MVERNSDKIFSCKLCLNETTKNLCIANCIGCKNIFCFDHLIQHRQDLANQFDQLIKQHADMKNKAFIQLNIDQHLEYIDKWECETIELIHKHAKDAKEKFLSIFNTYKSELKQHHTQLGQELNNKRDSRSFFERDITDLSQRIDHLDKEIEYSNKLLHNINVNELNQIINKYNLSNPVGILEDKIKHWNYLHEIKLDSTYGYMAANNQQIFLGWKNRIVIYNLDGTKHDETRLQSTEIYGELCDLIWSSIMQSFFILCRKSLFVHYPSSSQVEILSNISLINQDNQFISLTSYKNNLILLNEKSLDIWKYDKNIFLLDYSILISLIIKNCLDETICCIRANEENLAILIQNTKTHTWRLDIYNFFPFQRIHMGLSFDRFNQLNLGLFISFHNNSYLFMNWETKFMRIIDQNHFNEVIDYNAYNACLLGTQRILVVNYMTHLKVYEF